MWLWSFNPVVPGLLLKPSRKALPFKVLTSKCEHLLEEAIRCSDPSTGKYTGDFPWRSHLASHPGCFPLYWVTSGWWPSLVPTGVELSPWFLSSGLCKLRVTVTFPVSVILELQVQLLRRTVQSWFGSIMRYHHDLVQKGQSWKAHSDPESHVM